MRSISLLGSRSLRWARPARFDKDHAAPVELREDRQEPASDSGLSEGGFRPSVDPSASRTLEGPGGGPPPEPRAPRVGRAGRKGAPSGTPTGSPAPVSGAA